LNRNTTMMKSIRLNILFMIVLLTLILSRQPFFHFHVGINMCTCMFNFHVFIYVVIFDVSIYMFVCVCICMQIGMFGYTL